jgi:hypothetical protein
MPRPSAKTSLVRFARLPEIVSDGWQTRFLGIICKRCTTDEQRYGELLSALAIAPNRVPWYLGREKIMWISEPKSDSPNTLRKGHDQPAATSVHGWRIDLALAFVGYESSFEFPLTAGTLRRAIRNPDWSVVDGFTQPTLWRSSPTFTLEFSRLVVPRSCT